MESQQKNFSQTVEMLKSELKQVAAPYIAQLEVSAMTGEDYRAEALKNYNLLEVKDAKIAEL